MFKHKKQGKKAKRGARIPHDALFKRMMLDIRIAKDFLNRTLSNDFKQQVDLSTIKIEKESFVQDDLKKKLSDIVYSVKTKDNKKAFVYVLIESQSSSDYWIALRLWQYMLLLCEQQFRLF